jgi:signal transduction histidine kinase
MPSRPPHRFRRSTPARRWLPVLLLLGSLGVAGLATLEAHRSAISHRETAEGLLRDYSAIAAWSWRQQSWARLATAFHQTLEPVAHGKHRAGGVIRPVEVLWEEQLTAADTGCAIVRPGAPYYFRLESDGTLTFAGEAPAGAVRAWLAATVGERAATAPREEERLIAGEVEGEWRYAVIAAMGAPEEPATVYGFGMDPARYARMLELTFLERPLLPEALARGRPNEELLVTRVVLPGGTVLFESGEAGSWERGAADSLGVRMGGATVEATVRPEIAASLIIGGLPRSRLPWLAGLFALAAGLAAVAAGQVRREAELSRLRADFVSSASHELRTPLAQIRLFLETLRLGRYSSDSQREWILENLDRETTRLTGLVENVLHFSRRRNPAARVATPVEVQPFLDRVVAGFRPLAASRQVEITVAAEPGLAVPAREDELRQVLLNLLDNAVKYGPVGQRIAVEAALTTHGRAAIAVSDQGPGVDAAERETVWEPFRRGERAIGSVAVGSGIGLSVVREIVGAHGGEARVESAPGGGARFVVELPGGIIRAPAHRGNTTHQQSAEASAHLQRVG